MGDDTSTRIVSDSPATFVPSNPNEKPSPGIALCLSGGGYRAMVFHLGALLRLNEFGLLKKLDRISSVSGGSITAGVLGLKWKKLIFGGDNVAQNLIPEVIDPIRALAATTIDAGSIFAGALLPGTISEWIAGHYEKSLFGNATLQDLPAAGAGPRFVINATNVQTGSLWRFSQPYMGDYQVGRVKNPTLKLAVAVAASSAFPPVLSPAVIELDPAAVVPDVGSTLNREPFTSRVVLSDGGVYDNMGIETAWKSYQTVLVSDAGGKIEPEGEPKEDWARHAYRVLDLIDNQVRCLRKRQIIDAFKHPAGGHNGTYWGIRTDIADYHFAGAMPVQNSRLLADLPTRLKAMDKTLQEKLINWGYAVCDAALQTHAKQLLPAILPSQIWPFSSSKP